jgi:hypothetical protein
VFTSFVLSSEKPVTATQIMHNIHSPYEVLRLDISLDRMVEAAVLREQQQQQNGDDDTEGWPLFYSSISPAVSAISSPAPSRPSSPDTGTQPAETTASALANSATPVTSPQKSPIKTRQQRRAILRRARKRAEQKEKPGGRKIRSSFSRKYRELPSIPVKFNVRNLPVSQPGFIGKRLAVSAGCHALQRYKDEGFKVIQWDGRSAPTYL